MSKVHVLGLVPGGRLEEQATRALLSSKLVLASTRLYGIFKEYAEFIEVAERVKVIDSIEDTVASAARARSDVAVLASGDPLFFGIGSVLISRLEKNVLLYPALSSIQRAFARVGLGWQDAVFISLHGAKKREWSAPDLPLLCERHAKLALLTGGQNAPDTLAPLLPPKCEVHVLERLGYPEERHTKGSPAAIARRKFKDPNIMIVLNKPGTAPVFGLSESEFKTEAALITKDEVRAVVLHKLRLPAAGTLWDIGAGSGSISIEARRMNPALVVHAVEAATSRVRNIKANASALKAGDINIVQGIAPEALKGLTPPTRVFIGGSGGRMKPILKHVSKAMPKGIIVIAAVVLEGMTEAKEHLEALGFRVDVTGLTVARSAKLGKGTYMRGMNPVYIIRGER